MATRSLIRFAKREDGVSFSEHPERVEVQVYKHYDGYPEGHPVDLAKFLNEFKIVNGLGRDTYKRSNGLTCLAAQYIAEFKEQPGDLYVENPDSKHGDLDYITYVWGDYHKGIWMSIFRVGYEKEDNCIFVGKPQKLINKYEE